MTRTQYWLLQLAILGLVVACFWAVLGTRQAAGDLRDRNDTLTLEVKALHEALEHQGQMLQRQRAETEALRARLAAEELRTSWDEGLRKATLDVARVAQ